MPIRTDRFVLKNVVCALLVSMASMPIFAADLFNCSIKNQDIALKKICSNNFKEDRHELNNKFLVAYLVTDAPTQLLFDTHHFWLNRLKQCKNNTCLQKQFTERQDQLNFYTSLNQSLTQHFLKFEDGHIASYPVHLQVHQLSKDSIKIEGTAYRDPNNKTERQVASFLAYTTPDKKNQIFDNEHDCRYDFDFQKSILVVKTQQKGCERFAGIYKRYD